MGASKLLKKVKYVQVEVTANISGI